MDEIEENFENVQYMNAMQSDDRSPSSEWDPISETEKQKVLNLGLFYFPFISFRSLYLPDIIRKLGVFAIKMQICIMEGSYIFYLFLILHYFLCSHTTFHYFHF
jgi:hypothetical protein